MNEIARNHHLTDAVRMTPHGIVGTAKADMERRARNVGRAERNEADGMERYAFAGSHVRAASDVADLIRRAIKGRAKTYAAKRGRRSIFLLYRHAEPLQEALRLAENGQQSERNDDR